ncbi:MAG TPA: MASE4 domain-containing protein [Candidatus Sulfotelmatobacter sp.]|nr:MASE4 domain-containing protein [Candidatus Sulfotelmatobacter sp.]
MRSVAAVGSLSTFPASRLQRTWACAVLVVLGLFVLAIVPIAGRHLLAIPPFLPTFTTFVIVTDLLTAALLYRDAWNARSLSLNVLASGYLFSGLIVIPHVLTFPGVYGSTGFASASSQTAVWLWAAWHAGFPAFALASAIFARWHPRLAASGGMRSRLAAPAATIVLAVLVAALVLGNAARLPVLLVGSDYHRIIISGVGPAIVVLSALAMIAQVALPGTRTVAPLWVTVAVGAMLLDTVLTLDGGGRYSAGWYLSRCIAVFGSGIVLFALLRETGRLVESATQAERRLRTIVDGVGDALLGLDDEGRIVDANPAAITLFGVPEAALRARLASEVVRTSPVPLELSVGENVVIARDVTERRRAEAAAREAIASATEAAAIKSRFLATMSHEIRTPINAVVGMSELMLQTPLTDEARDYAHTVRESAEALLGVINEILDYSKIEAGATELERIAFSPLQAVEAAADIISTAARKKHLALATHVAPDVPRRALGDPHRLRQILLNLIGNAVKFTAAGYVTVRASVERTEGERISVLRFAVSDTGPGVSPDAAPRLFEPFRQADAGTTRRFGGTGLGLSISKRLVELMGGEIGFESAPGSGATFWFTVPFERCAEDEPGGDVVPALRGARVLVVDGEDATRGVVEQYLFSWGAIAIGGSSVQQAIDLASAALGRGTDLDAILMAEQPGSDPGAALARLREATGTRARALLLTENDQPGQAERAFGAGYSGSVRKPLKQSMLHDALADTLAGTPAPAAPVEPVRAAPIDGLAILIADDNAVNRKLTLQQLKKLGYQAEAVEDGKEAVDAVLARHYDLILMDCEMPRLDGYAATRMIRAAERHGTTHIRIVAMTANALDGDREACLAAGMDDYLAKPVQLESLRGAIERGASARFSHQRSER